MIKQTSKLQKAALLIAISFLSACGGGSNNGELRAVGGSGEQWHVLANISKNGCGERISNVEQTFTVSSDRVNTSLSTVPIIPTGSGFDFSYSDTNGDCQRTYSGHFSNISGNTATVELISDSACSTVTCQNTWSGTATKL